jgi:small subunit ribosomal protein S20
MPNIKSQEKRDRQNIKRAGKNQAIRKKIKTLNKKFEESVEEKDKENAGNNLNKYFQILDKAAKLKSIHKNFAANKKSRAAKLFNSMKTKKV